MRLQTRTTPQCENLQEWLCFYIDLKVAVPRVAGDMEMNVYETVCAHVPTIHPVLKPILFSRGATFRKDGTGAGVLKGD